MLDEDRGDMKKIIFYIQVTATAAYKLESYRYLTYMFLTLHRSFRYFFPPMSGSILWGCRC